MTVEYIARFDDYGAYSECELVRCKDCRFADEVGGKLICKVRELWHEEVDRMGYCWKGKRREG
jgi:hypothetical protein